CAVRLQDVFDRHGSSTLSPACRPAAILLLFTCSDNPWRLAHARAERDFHHTWAYTWAGSLWRNQEIRPARRGLRVVLALRELGLGNAPSKLPLLIRIPTCGRPAMKVKEYLATIKRVIITCRPEDTMETAATLLATNHIGAMPVRDANGRIVGMFS